MNIEDIKNKIKQQENDSWGTIRDFLIVFWGNDLDDDSIKRLLRTHYQLKPDYVIRSIVAGKAVLAVSDYDEALLHAISWDVNKVLDEHTTEAARKWLKDALQISEEIVSENK